MSINLIASFDRNVKAKTAIYFSALPLTGTPFYDMQSVISRFQSQSNARDVDVTIPKQVLKILENNV